MILDSWWTRNHIQPAGIPIVVTGVRLKENSINSKLVVSCAAMALMLVFSALAALAMQRNSAETDRVLLKQAKHNELILITKADIAESMFPAHDYLIERARDEHEENRFIRLASGVKKNIKRLRAGAENVPKRRRAMDRALDQFLLMEKVQKEIFALKGQGIDKLGAEKMEEMHKHQYAILEKFDDFKRTEQAELKKLAAANDAHNERSTALIAAAAAVALGVSLFIGYLGSKP